MDYPIIGQIQLFAFPFAPMGWLSCDGQVLTVNQYQTVFSLIGFTYGGNGSTTFALPDLRNASPVPGMKYYFAMEGMYPQRS